MCVSCLCVLFVVIYVLFNTYYNLFRHITAIGYKISFIPIQRSHVENQSKWECV